MRFCATDSLHESRSEFLEAVEKFIDREDIPMETKQKIMTENPKRTYPLALH
jgi:hypothetical protein